jgi:hypothetical protein
MLPTRRSPPPSRYPISGWRLYSRVAPFVILENHDCQSTAVGKLAQAVCLAAGECAYTADNPGAPGRLAAQPTAVVCAAV